MGPAQETTGICVESTHLPCPQHCLASMALAVAVPSPERGAGAGPRVPEPSCPLGSLRALAWGRAGCGCGTGSPCRHNYYAGLSIPLA